MMLINGQPAESLPATDRGLQYGDGLFETLAVRAGVPCHLERHLVRLRAGCARLALEFDDFALLEAEITQLAAEQAQAVIKVLVTRGSGARGYRPTANSVCTRIVSRYPWPAYPAHWQQQGIRVRLCSLRLGMNPALAGLKHLNRLENVLARAEWDDPEIPEGILCDTAGRVIGGTMSNLFLVRDQTLLTPRLDQAGVAGITRQRVLALAARLKIRNEEAELSLADLYNADESGINELFVCNTLAGIWPVREFAQRQLPVGPITRRLQQDMDTQE